MMEIIDGEPEMNIKNLFSCIVDECNRQGGVSVLESFLEKNA
jgi:hypothetical protein